MINKIRNNLKSIALLEAVISPDWDSRYYSYNSKWSEGEEMASMRDGCGDEWFLWIKNDRAALKVFRQDSVTLSNIDDIKNQFPAIYSGFITEPAFSINSSTSLWYVDNNEWVKFDVDAEQTNQLVSVFDWTSLDYKSWAEDYYEDEFPKQAIDNIMSGTMTENDVRSLNSSLTLNDIKDEINEIGYGN